MTARGQGDGKSLVIFLKNQPKMTCDTQLIFIIRIKICKAYVYFFRRECIPVRIPLGRDTLSTAR